MPLTFNGKPALVAYLTCGDPDLRVTREVALAAISAGAEVIELGVPFSDPVADGPVIQRASERALKNGVALSDVLKVAAEIRRESDAGLIVFTYLNPILRMGMEKFAAKAAEAGVDGALITDLPVEEADEYLRHMRKRNLATVFLAAPTSTDARLKRIAELSTGFVYAVSRTGITGARKELPEDAKKLVQRCANLPNYLSQLVSEFRRQSSSPPSANLPMPRWSAAPSCKQLKAIPARKPKLWQNL